MRMQATTDWPPRPHCNRRSCIWLLRRRRPALVHLHPVRDKLPFVTYFALLISANSNEKNKVDRSSMCQPSAFGTRQYFRRDRLRTCLLLKCRPKVAALFSWSGLGAAMRGVSTLWPWSSLSFLFSHWMTLSLWAICFCKYCLISGPTYLEKRMVNFPRHFHKLSKFLNLLFSSTSSICDSLLTVATWDLRLVLQASSVTLGVLCLWFRQVLLVSL